MGRTNERATRYGGTRAPLARGAWRVRACFFFAAAAALQGGPAFAQRGGAGEREGPAATQAYALAAEGEQVYEAACVACHGEDGTGGHGGGAPLDQVKDAAMVIATVTDGRGNMPPLGAVLTPEQIRAVAAYVVDALFE